MAKIIGDRWAIRAHAAEYDRVADFLHDETEACSRCGQRWYQPSQGKFDADIAAADGDLVCQDCASDHLIEATERRGWGTDAAVGEHGTLHARLGEVVG